jgi:PAS domain S-box-containing protein
MVNSSISRLSFYGMMVVTWVSIVLIGGAWGGWMLYDFEVQADQLRVSHYAEQKALMRSEVEKGVQTLDTIRADGVQDLWEQIRKRGHQAKVVASQLHEKNTSNLSSDSIMRIVADAMKSFRPGDGGVSVAIGQTLYFIEAFPKDLDDDYALAQLSEALINVKGGERRVQLGSPDGVHRYTILMQIMTLKESSWRVVSGACLEVAEEETRHKVVRQLERVRFGDDSYLFGGSWQGISILGPAKGKNMWEASDKNGVKIVQRLVAAARNGGGFVSYVMPKVDGNRHTQKVSFVMPIPDWEWYIGAGLYVDDIESLIAQKSERLEADILHKAGFLLLTLSVLSMVVLFVCKWFSWLIRNNLNTFTDVWDKASTSGDLVDPERLQFREFKELAAAANQMVSDRWLAEAAANESASSFQTLVGNIPGVVYQCVYQDDSIRFVSPSVNDIIGFSPSEFKEGGRTLASLVEPTDAKWVREVIEGAVGKRHPFSLEYRIRRADNRIRWVLDQGQAQYDNEGKPTVVDGVLIDITDRREAEEDHYSHLHFLKTMERIDQSIRRNDDMETMLSEVLEVVRNSFGADRCWLLYPCDPDAESYRIPVERTAAEYPGMGLDMKVPVSPEAAHIMREALEVNGPIAYDAESTNSLSVYLMEEFSIQAMLSAAVYPRIGSPWLMGLHQCRSSKVWSSDEIELFKEASRRIADALSNNLIMQELRNSEEKFRTFSEQTMLGLCVLQNDTVRFANKAFCDIFEMSVEEMLALSPGEFIKYVHPDDQELLLEQAAKKQAGDASQITTYSWRAITASGRVRWVEIHSKTAMVEGRPANLVSLHDITEAKLIREDMKGQVEERTADLAAKAAELEKAHARLTMLDDLKSSFLTTVSHDMRTPLTSILGYSRLIQREMEKLLSTQPTDSTEAQERILSNVNVLDSEARRLGSLIDEFMDLTVIKAGTAVWNDKSVLPGDVIQRAANRYAPIVADKPEVEFVLDLPGYLAPMYVDPARLEQVVFSLMDNSLKFTSSGTVAVHAHNDEYGGLVLSVKDTGKGVPQSELGLVFEPFHQVELGDTLVDDIKGSGLGLTLCKGIVEHYGGTVGVESTLGEGSVFTVYFPVRAND